MPGEATPRTAHLPPRSTHGQTTPQQDALSVILVTGGYDNTIRFWEAWSGACSRTLPHTDHQVNKLSISPDKRFLAAGGVNHIRLYDVGACALGTGATAPLASFNNGHNGNVTALAWNAEGKWIVSASEDRTVKVWDFRASQPQRTYVHSHPVNDATLHYNQGEIVSCDQGGAIKIWDLTGDFCSHELLPEEDLPMRSVSVASDGSALVAGNRRGIVYVWSNSPGVTFRDLQPRAKFVAHNKHLVKVLLSPNMKHLATSSADCSIKLWSTLPSSAPIVRSDQVAVDGSFQLEKVLKGHQRWVWDMAYSADSAYLVSASSDHTARLWDLSTGATVRRYSGHHKACVCVALNDSSV